MFDKGFFGGLFDFNGDGKLDGFERAADFATFHQMMSESDKESKDSFDSDEELLEDELEAAGLDLNDLEYMDEEERFEALEDAGLDPDDFDFD